MDAGRLCCVGQISSGLNGVAVMQAEANERRLQPEDQVAVAAPRRFEHYIGQVAQNARFRVDQDQFGAFGQVAFDKEAGHHVAVVQVHANRQYAV